MPEATTLPWDRTTMWSQRAPTSCMMWLEKSTATPSSRSRRMKSRIARVEGTSRPLVGSSSKNVSGAVHEGARDRDLDALAGREALGAAVGDVLHVEELYELVDARLELSAALFRGASRSSGCSRAS